MSTTTSPWTRTTRAVYQYSAGSGYVTQYVCKTFASRLLLIGRYNICSLPNRPPKWANIPNVDL